MELDTMSDLERFDDHLRQALDAPVATGDPSELVAALQRRKQQRRRNRRVLQGAAAGAVVAMLAVGLPLALRGDHGGRRTRVAIQHSTTTVQAPASEAPDAGVVGEMSTTTT